MIHKFKLLAIAIVATLAFSSLAASLASGDELRSEGGKTVVMSGTHITKFTFTTTAGTAQCNKVSTTATSKTPASTITFTPVYEQCTCFGIACTLDMNGCDYLGHLGAATTATLDIVCSAGKEITVTSAKCTLHIKAQTGLGSITFKNIGAGSTRELEAVTELKNVSYTHTTGEGIGKCTTGSSSTGLATGTSKVTAVEDGSNVHVGIWVE